MKRLGVLIGFLVVALGAAVVPPGRLTEAQAGCFSETGFCVTNPAFLDYFNSRGQVRIFGYPVSRSFTLEGFEVQIFQRVVLQMNGGQVARLNVLDPNVMPMTRANQSQFPAPDPALAQAAPQTTSPNYARQVVEFVRSVAPDTLSGQPVGFFTLFNTTVPPPPGANPDIVTLLNLEIWGVPTSRTTPDPNNGGFIYQRFQRGIMHFRAEVPVTEGILVGEYFKAVITAQALPPDLAEDMRNSRYLGQYNPQVVNAVARPAQLPNTSMVGAFVPGTNAVTPPTGPPPTPIPTQPAGPTATSTATATPTATSTPISTASVDLQIADDLVNPGEQTSITVIGTSTRGITWIEWTGDDTDDPALDDEYRFDCDDLTRCANVWNVTPTKSGRHIIRARLRDNLGTRTDWVSRELRVRDAATPTPTPGAPTPTPGAGTPTVTPTPVPPNVRIQLSEILVNRNQSLTVTVIATSDRGLDWIEWRGDDTGDEALDENHRFDCENRRDCANVWTVTPTVAGSYDILARARVQGGDRSDWVRAELRVR